MANTTIMPYLSPAKLNLFLHITSQREDGYHNLQTVFHFLDYYDELTFSLRHDTQITLEIEGNKQLAVKDNLIVHAAKILQDAFNLSQGVDIYLKKRIPIGGGLGGGSSNAATTLMVLNRLWGINVNMETLIQFGKNLGADIPVFIFSHSAWAEGIGDKLRTIVLDELWYLVVIPPVHVVTAELFAAKSLPRNKTIITENMFLQGKTENVFTSLVRERYPEVDDAFRFLEQYGQARLTGTGGCVFISASSKAKILSVYAKLPKPLAGFFAKGKNKSPLYCLKDLQ